MSEILMLDVRTLAFVSSVGGFLLAAAMLGIHQAGMRERCLLDWFASGLATGGGFLIGHLFQTVGIPLPGWVVAGSANAMIALGHGFLLVGVQRYLGRFCWTWIVPVFALGMLVSPLVFPELRDSLRLRVIFHSFWYAVVLSLAAGLLWNARDPGMRRFHRMAATIFALYALFLWTRWLYALFGESLTTSFVQDPFQALTFVSAMLFSFFIAVALALIMFRENQLKLQTQAEIDPLTGIKNRLTMDRAVADASRHARTTNSPLGVMLLDVDNFKEINDQYGHHSGDQALRQVAKIILDELRGEDVAFRYGGEEFLILLPGTQDSNLLRVADRLRHRIAHGVIETDRGQLTLTASIGVTEFRYRNEDWEETIKRVDDTLYKAKRSGKNRIERV